MQQTEMMSQSQADKRDLETEIKDQNQKISNLNHEIELLKNENAIFKNEINDLRSTNRGLDTTKFTQEKSITEFSLKYENL